MQITQRYRGHETAQCTYAILLLPNANAHDSLKIGQTTLTTGQTGNNDSNSKPCLAFYTAFSIIGNVSGWYG